MAELDYTPSSAARRLSFGRTLTISVVTSFLTRPQAAERLRGIDAVLSDSEFDLVIYNVETVEKRDQYLRGLALAAAHRRAARRLAAAARGGRPADCRRPRSRSWSSTRTHPRSRGCPTWSATTSPAARPRRGTSLELGHRRIAFVGDEFDNPFGFTSSRHRYMGYERAVRTPPGYPSEPTSWRWARTAATRRASWRLGCWSCDEPPDAPSSPPATRRRWASSARRTRPACASPTTSRSSATTTSRSPTTSGLTTVRQHLFESGRLGAELLLSRDPGALGDAALDRPAPRGRGPRHHGATEGGPSIALTRRRRSARPVMEEV